jgi:hypothetical protein
MTDYNTLNAVLAKFEMLTDAPYAYYEFKEPVTADRYVAFFESEKIPHYADNKTYTYDHGFAIELYTKVKEPETEEKLINLLAEYEIPWSGGETVKIDNDNVFMTTFYC